MPLTAPERLLDLALGAGFVLSLPGLAWGSDRFQPYLIVSGTGGEALFDGPGDIDGDGRDDLLLAWVPPGGLPLARVRSGSNGALIFQLSPQPYSGGFLGLGGVGGNTTDLNADGHGELILVRTGQDMVHVRSGLDGSLMYTLTPAMFGWSPLGFGGIIGGNLSAPGDLSGDGSPDLIVLGGYSASCREVVVLGGPSLGLLYQHSAGCGTPFGSSLGPLEDVSGDGYPDYFIGDPGFAPNTALPNAGWIGFYSGATGQLMTSVAGMQPGQGLGIAACGLDDIDGDGQPEMALAEFWPSGSVPPGIPPQITVRSWGNLAPLYSMPGLVGVVQALRDADGDGLRDILVWLQGGTTVLSAAAGTVLFDRRPSPMSFFSNATPLGDVNGDGLGDFGETRWPPAWVPFAPAAAQELTWGTITSNLQYESWVFVARNLEVVGPTVVGGSVQFDLMAPKHQGKTFQIVLSHQGSIPGVPLGPFLLPVVPDALFVASYGAGIVGALGPNGTGTVTVPIPSNPSLQGLELVASGVVYDPAGPLGIACTLTGVSLRIQ